jgi:hypothetical protein
MALLVMSAQSTVSRLILSMIKASIA